MLLVCRQPEGFAKQKHLGTDASSSVHLLGEELQHFVRIPSPSPCLQSMNSEQIAASCHALTVQFTYVQTVEDFWW